MTQQYDLPPMSFVLSGFCKDTQDSIRHYANAAQDLAIDAIRKRIAEALSDRHDAVEAANVNRDAYILGMAAAYDIAEQIALGDLEK